MALILDGQTLARTIRAEIAIDVAAFLRTRCTPPGLATVLVGDDPASEVYVRNKRKACQEAGMVSMHHTLPASTSQIELLALIDQLNADPGVHGILVQLPLPKQIDEGAVLRAIHPVKDIDVFHPENVGLLAAGRPRYLPCTPFGVQQLLARNQIATAGRHVVIVGRSNIVGKPLALMLMQKPSRDFPEGGNATVTIAHAATHDLPSITRTADILVAAVGRAGFITPEMVQPGAAVIDVGINKLGDRIVGDVDPAVADIASALSPVPRGVGPMTITMLLHNTLRAARMQSQPTMP